MENYDRKSAIYTLMTSTIASFMGPFMISSVNLALPSIEKEFAADAVLLSWTVTSFVLSYAVFMIPFGRFAEIAGRKKIFFNGVVVFTLSSFVAPFSFNIWMFLGCRFVQGIGSAMISTSGLAILTSVFPAAKRGRVLGINTAAVYIGISAGPFVGGLLVKNLGWESIFFAVVPIGIIVAILIKTMIQGEWAHSSGESFDMKGAVVYGSSLVFVLIGSTLLPNLSSAFFFVAGVTAILYFVIHELAVKYPVFEVRLFRQNRVFAFSNIAALINYSSTACVAFLLSLYLQKVKGFDPAAAGSIMVVQPLIMAVFSPAAGRLSDRVEPRQLASFGMGLSAAGLLMLSSLSQDSSLLRIISSLVILGIGFSLFSSPNMNSIMSSVENRYYGTASASAGTMRVVGQILSMSMTIIVFSILIGRSEITPDKYPGFLKSMNIIFIVSAILCFIGVFFSMARGELRKKE